MSRQASRLEAICLNPSRFFISQMYLCYIDESGTSNIPGNTSHFVLAGLSIPIKKWKFCDRQIEKIKSEYHLPDSELHVAWILRPYLEQSQIPDFETMDRASRIFEVKKFRRAELLRLQKKNPRLYRQTRKNYQKTEDYIHLTHAERVRLITDVAKCIAGWSFARLFAECIDKIRFDPTRSNSGVDEQALEQIVSRFERYLKIVHKTQPDNCFGLLIHDNNPTIAHKHTQLMKRFHDRGTLWIQLHHIIETPLFVDSQLTGMVQIADLCAYAIRRYLENGETELFDLVFQRADRNGGVAVGIRHYSDPACDCFICVSHKKIKQRTA